MKLSLTNFKTWKKETFTFPNKGLIALSGSSGKGKSSIFESIQFALYGKPKKVATFGEKKCKVELEFSASSVGCIKGDKIKITRTKGPEYLSLEMVDEKGKDKQVKYENAVAQGIINKHFGEDFLLTSYMAQKCDTTFLRLSAAEKSTFLEKMAFNGADITSLKKKTKVRIKEIKDRQTKKSGELSALSEEFKAISQPEEMTFPINNITEEEGIKKHSEQLEKTTKNLRENEKKKLSLEYTIKDVLAKQERLEELNQELLQLTMEIDKIKIESSSLNYSQNEFEDVKKRLDISIKNKELNDMKEKYQSDLELYKKLSQQEGEEIEREMEEIRSEIEKIEVIPDKVDSLKKEKMSKQKELDSLLLRDSNKKRLLEKEKLLEKLKSESKLLLGGNNSGSLDIQKKHSELKAKIDDINSRINIKNCPHCKGPFRITNGGDVISSNYSLSQVELKNLPGYKTELKELEKTIHEESIRKRECEVLEQTIKELKLTVEQIEKNISPGTSTQSLKKEIEALEINISEQIKIDFRYSELNKKLNQLSESGQSKGLLDMKNKLLKTRELIKSRENKEEVNNEGENDSIDSLNSKFRELSISKQKDMSMRSEITKYNSRIDKTKDEISKIGTDIPDLSETEKQLQETKDKIVKGEDKLKTLNRIHEKIKKYLELKEKMKVYLGWEEKVKGKEKELKSISEELITANTFFKLILDTESEAIEEVLTNINYNVRYYIEKFFPDNNMEVEIRSFKETKKGDEKPEISVNIFYKENECELSSLSGGERDRLELAFMLALNNLLTTPQINGVGVPNIILLDECISSLHQELSTEILECLKEEEKLILVVSHQIILGAFDNVMDFDKS